MKTLRIIRIKPNPVGKDRTRAGTATPAQLGAEWVDFQNNGSSVVGLEGVELFHVAYAPGATQGHWEKIMSFTGVLDPGHIVRVHSGQPRDLSVLYADDLAGAEHHLFTGRDSYVWNNREADTPSLWFSKTSTWIDQASYRPNPPEGAILVRVSDLLVSPVAKAGSF